MGAIKNDEHIEEKVKASLVKMREKEPTKTQIFELQRENVQLLLNLHREELVAKQNLGKVVNYFVIQ